MAKLFGKDTYLIEQRSEHSMLSGFLIYVLLIADITFFIFLWKIDSSNLTKYFFATLLIATYLALHKKINKELLLQLDFNNGLLGEQSVENILQKLPDDYTIYENVILPGKQSNTDFVIVGPNGIFVVEVKSHKGRISYDGIQLLRYGKRFEHNFLWQAKGEARDVSKYLKDNGVNEITVEPLLVFSNKFVSIHFGKKPLDGVHVIGTKWLLETVQNIKKHQTIPSNQLLRIHTILEKTVQNPTT